MYIHLYHPKPENIEIKRVFDLRHGIGLVLPYFIGERTDLIYSPELPEIYLPQTYILLFIYKCIDIVEYVVTCMKKKDNNSDWEDMIYILLDLVETLVSKLKKGGGRDECGNYIKIRFIRKCGDCN